MAQPLLKRFEITLFRDNSPTDNTQVPATDATIDIYRQGATLKTGFDFLAIYNDPVSIEVYDVGRISSGDTLHVFQGGLSVGTLLVDSVPDSSHLNVLNSAPMSGSVNERLIATGDRPVISWNPLGVSAGLHYTTTHPVTGRASGYVLEERFDFIASGTGFTPRVFPDAEGGFVQGPPGVFDIRDFGGDIQAVLDLISEGFPMGGIVHIPKGSWEQSDVLVIKGGRVIIEGEGQDTRVVGKDKDTHVFRIVPQTGSTGQAYDITFRDLMIEGNADDDGDGDGINWEADEEARATALHMDHVAVNGCGRDGLHLEYIDFPVILDCSFDANYRDGAHLFSVAQSLLLGYYANTNHRWGLYCEEAGGHFVQANGIEGNHTLTGAAATDGQLKFKNCGGMVVRSEFENFTKDGAKTAIDLEGARGVVVEGCGFTTSRPPHTAVGIRIRGGCKSVTIGANSFNGCGVCVDASDSNSSGVNIVPQDDNGGNLEIVSYPTGDDANGWQGLLALVQAPAFPELMKIPGIRIPFRKHPYLGPDPNVYNEGTLVYDRAADRGSNLLLSDGSYWWPVGGVPGGFAIGPPDTRPTDVAPGTMIWVPDAPSGEELQAWDGNSWQYIPIARRARRLWLPVSMWTQINGTSMALSGKGTYPNTMVSFSFIDAPTNGPQAIGITLGIPGDYVSGTDAAVSVVWAPGSTAPVANKTWVGRLHYTRIMDGMHYDATEDGVNSQVFSYWGGEESGDLQPSGPRAVVTQPWTGVIPSASLAAGGVLRLAFDRLSTDANDNFQQAVEVFGIVLEYTAER